VIQLRTHEDYVRLRGRLGFAPEVASRSTSLDSAAVLAQKLEPVKFKRPPRKEDQADVALVAQTLAISPSQFTAFGAFFLGALREEFSMRDSMNVRLSDIKRFMGKLGCFLVQENRVGQPYEYGPETEQIQLFSEQLGEGSGEENADSLELFQDFGYQIGRYWGKNPELFLCEICERHSSKEVEPPKSPQEPRRFPSSQSVLASTLNTGTSSEELEGEFRRCVASDRKLDLSSFLSTGPAVDTVPTPRFPERRNTVEHLVFSSRSCSSEESEKELPVEQELSVEKDVCSRPDSHQWQFFCQTLRPVSVPFSPSQLPAPSRDGLEGQGQHFRLLRLRDLVLTTMVFLCKKLSGGVDLAALALDLSPPLNQFNQPIDSNWLVELIERWAEVRGYLLGVKTRALFGESRVIAEALLPSEWESVLSNSYNYHGNSERWLRRLPWADLFVKGKV